MWASFDRTNLKMGKFEWNFTFAFQLPNDVRFKIKITIFQHIDSLTAKPTFICFVFLHRFGSIPVFHIHAIFFWCSSKTNIMWSTNARLINKWSHMYRVVRPCYYTFVFFTMWMSVSLRVALLLQIGKHKSGVSLLKMSLLFLSFEC